MRISAERVAQLAHLARLRLTAEETQQMRRDLEAILTHVETLAEVPTEDVPPTAHVLDVATPFRADEVAGVLPGEEAVRNAPQRHETAVVVPRILE